MAKKTAKKVAKKVAKKAAVKKAVAKKGVDLVNQPPHYKQHPSGIEAIEVIEDMKHPTLASAAKYWLRRDFKDSTVMDLQKMLWYVEREIGRRLSPKKPVEKAKLRGEVLKHEKSKILGYLLEADSKAKDVEALKKAIPGIKRAIAKAKKENK